MRWWNGNILALAMLQLTLLSPSATAQDSLLMQPAEVFAGDQLAPSPAVAETLLGPKSSAYPEGDYYEQLNAAGGQAGSCGAGGCDPGWGCGGSPFRTGPGKCDDWRVGPRWRVVLDGILLYREDTDLAPLAAAIGTTLAAAEQTQNFDHGGGVRLLGTSYWPQCQGYELALGYVGVEEWNANVVLPAVDIPPIVGPPALVGVQERRTLTYRSSLHALELNWQALNNSVWKPYAGVRFFRLDEAVEDKTSQYTTDPLGVGQAAITTEMLDQAEIENNLIGFQLGVRRDLWQVSRKVYVQGFLNGGMYCNLIDRFDTVSASTTSTIILADDPTTTMVDETGQTQSVTQSTGNRLKTERTEVAFAGEAAVTLVWKLNRCCALRSGYEVMVLSGVELADDAFLGNAQSRDLVFHGGFAGFEYRR